MQKALIESGSTTRLTRTQDMSMNRAAAVAGVHRCTSHTDRLRVAALIAESSHSEQPEVLEQLQLHMYARPVTFATGSQMKRKLCWGCSVQMRRVQPGCCACICMLNNCGARCAFGAVI